MKSLTYRDIADNLWHKDQYGIWTTAWFAWRNRYYAATAATNHSHAVLSLMSFMFKLTLK